MWATLALNGLKRGDANSQTPGKSSNRVKVIVPKLSKHEQRSHVILTMVFDFQEIVFFFFFFGIMLTNVSVTSEMFKSRKAKKS